ncbi:MAG: PHP domain-containing protein [Chloroflexota bacterium]|nr:PHP domain-containing protein [Chloroflexota bacterium]MDE3192524.1 PHP domain-containing protein [Chloroflexota bacterium]
MGRADLQLHSDLGDGLSPPEALLDAAERARLDVIAVTDHDDIRGSFQARDEAARRGSSVAVITGMEVTTRAGHVIALFLEDEVPMLRPLDETIVAIHRLGGVAIVPHPLSYLTFSVGERALRELAERADEESFVDAIEVRNPSYAGRVRASRARWLNAHVLRIAETGSSDAHHSALVATAWTEFSGATAEELRDAIARRATVAGGRSWTLREHLDGVVEQQWRAMLRDPAKRVWRRYVR